MFEKLRQNLNALSRDARESISLRCRLAMIELKADLANLRGLAIVLVLTLTGVLTGIAVLAVWVAQILNHFVPLPLDLWTVIVGLSTIGFSLVIAIWAWFRFRRRWIGLEQTIEELREDINWLKEWAGKSE